MRIRILLPALYALVCGCGQQFGEPIANGPGYRAAETFLGSPAAENPLASLEIPRHPHLAPQGQNGMHADSYCSGTYPWSGPLGNDPQVESIAFGRFGGECATLTVDPQGRLMSVCTDFLHMYLVLMTPDFEILALHELPLRASNKTLDLDVILRDSSGGVYFHLDNASRPLLANADNHFQVFSVAESDDGSAAWQVDADYDLNPHLPEGSLLTDAVPGWDGLIWFATRQGVVGTLDMDTTRVRTLQLDDEEIQNTLAVAEDGVFIVSDYALYQFEAGPDGTPAYTWRETYDRGTAAKPGSINQGSGTTPTLLGDDLVAIADNADNRTNILVYQREPEIDGRRLVCRVPVFAPGRSTTENSLIGYGRSLIAENNYGYSSPVENTWTEPGVVRIDVRDDLSGCDVVWENDTVASQTVVPKLSVENGLIYLYTREPVDRRPGVAAWYFSALDFETGALVYQVMTGTGTGYNNNWAPITLGQDGTAYVGTLRGMISIRDGG